MKLKMKITSLCFQNHPLKDLSQNKMYIRLHHQPNAIVIIEFQERQGSPCEMDFRYYLLWVSFDCY